jgi:hypothetical protein
MLAVARWFEALPGAVRTVAQPPTLAWALTIGGLLTLSLPKAPWRLAGALLFPAAAMVTAAAVPPDVFVGRDARQVAVRIVTEEGERLALLSRRRDRFSAEVWLEALGLEPVIAEQPKFGECGEPACHAPLPDGDVLTVAETPEAAALACREARVIVYTGWAPHALEGCAALLLTAEAVAESGPLTIMAGRVRTSAEVRGCRPWTGCTDAP